MNTYYYLNTVSFISLSNSCGTRMSIVEPTTSQRHADNKWNPAGMTIR